MTPKQKQNNTILTVFGYLFQVGGIVGFAAGVYMYFSDITGTQTVIKTVRPLIAVLIGVLILRARTKPKPGDNED